LVWYLDWPEYFQYSADASIDENLQLMYDGYGELPGCTAVKQNGLYVGIEDPDFGVVGVCCGSPDRIGRSERPSGFLNSFCRISYRHVM
jgi:hypothetical protein